MSLTTLLAIIGLISALLSCATAIMVFRREKRKDAVDSTVPVSLKVLKFKQATRDTSLKWVVMILFPCCLILIVLCLWAFYQTRSIAMIISAGFIALCLLPWLRVIRKGADAPSFVRRERQIKIEGDYQGVFDRCENALLAIGAGIVSSDRDIGLIYALTSETWKSFGERIEVIIQKPDHGECNVTLVSDCMMTPTILDYGKNSQNLDALIKVL
jgi:hypothetical protein